MMGKIYLGCSPSTMNGLEQKYQPSKNLPLPVEYSFESQMPPVLDQGKMNMCVPYALGSRIDWHINMDKKTKCKDNNVDKKDIYSARNDKGDNGMTLKDALHFIKTKGVKTGVGHVKINHYAVVGSELALKHALISNGPCVAGLRCYNSTNEFWNKGFNETMLGGHAVCIVGYNKDGFILRNSWGKTWGKGGYKLMKYKDFDKFFEIWTIID